MRRIWLIVALALAGAGSARADQMTPEQAAVVKKLQKINDSLHPQTGDIAIPGANVTLHLGKNYYFLPADEAKNVLVNAWGNPTNEVDDTLGLVFPATGHFYDEDGWAAVITFDPAGYVKSVQYSQSDFNDAEKAIRDGEQADNDARKKAGAEPMHFVGWAQPPRFDVTNHTMIWARDLKVGSETTDTLNYDVRVLGRRGYLSMNVVAAMPDLAKVRTAADELRQTADFQPGSRYADFDSSTDKQSELGIAGLVAAGAGAALAQKLGLFALIAVFFKKAAVFIIAAVGGAATWLRNRFGKPKAKV